MAKEFLSRGSVGFLNLAFYLQLQVPIYCVAFSNAQLALTGYNRVSDYYGFEIALPQVVSVPSFSIADIGEMVSFKEI